jgi:hypothetical protein
MALPEITHQNVKDLKGGKVVANTSVPADAYFFFVDADGNAGSDEFFFDEVGAVKTPLVATIRNYHTDSVTLGHEEEANEIYNEIVEFANNFLNR